MANITQGGDLMLFMGGKSIACATNHTLSISAETSDTSHKDIKAAWKASAVKTLSWEVSTENLFTLDGAGKQYDDLYTAMIAKTPITVVIGKAKTTGEAPTTGFEPATTGFYTGSAIITSLTLNAPNGDNATYSATFTGVGPLDKQA